MTERFEQCAEWCARRQIAWRMACIVSVGFLLLWVSHSQGSSPHAAMLRLEGPIGPASTAYLTRALARADEQGAALAIIALDTPGGLDAATRDIVQQLLDAPLPVAAYVHPAGARAASAGTYILLASHIAAMTPSTTLGAATPVSLTGSDPPAAEGDDGTASSSAAMRRKVVNDSVAFIRGLAERHGRNAEWAERAVREAATLTAAQALGLNVVDLVASSPSELLAQLDGRQVLVQGEPFTLATAELALEPYEPGWRDELLALITNPQIAYVLLMIGIYGLIFEGFNPGVLIPGTVGVICLVLGLYALQLLPVNYAGLALIVTGALLMVAETLLPSFGVLGIGGLIALALGSTILIDTDVPGFVISQGLIAGMVLGVSAALAGLMYFVGKSLRIKRIDVRRELIGSEARVAVVDGDRLQVRLRGELWAAHARVPVQVGDSVTVVAEHGLTLEVLPRKQLQGDTL